VTTSRRALSVLALTLATSTPGRAPLSPRDPTTSTPHRTTSHGTVRTRTFWSQALGTHKQYVIYFPPSYTTDTARRYPVAYYLHGLSGDEWNWVRSGHLDATMDSLVSTCAPTTRPCTYEMIIVMPDGDDGWYTTWNFLGDYAGCRRHPPRHDEPAATYCVPWPKYDEYIARDLVAHVDSTYRTLARREHRGIAGLSMGGYGAVTLALRYPDVFAAAASHSGVLSPLYAGPSPFAPPPRYATSIDTARARMGPLWPWMHPAFGNDTTAWLARDPARLAHHLLREDEPRSARRPALFLDIGRDDSLLVDGNRAFHYELTTLGLTHRYTEWPGKHDWSYWRTHARESLAWLAHVIG
jgi:S-formylglutathione hydrolase FrmB